ncbi:hypothetical protein B0A49_04412 [Cryomyces minteri]|uniref:Uncharacterized protein n=1 Tax=Cryomyces minteri TaxID=331657 RepID=A0A4U0X0J4_9PEZI|nr:hypothetical protein B0A49_04412 [Cryomyces minteri]
MAKTFDELIDYLLQEVALCGEQGASTKDFHNFVHAFYALPEATSRWSNHEKVNVSTSAVNEAAAETARYGKVALGDARGIIKQTIDRPLLDKIWKWLTNHPDARVGRDREGNGLTLSEVETTQSSSGITAPSEQHNDVGKVDSVITTLNGGAPAGSSQGGLTEVLQSVRRDNTAQNPDNEANSIETNQLLPQNGSKLSSLSIVRGGSIRPDSQDPKTGLRLYVNEDRMWYAITGHGVDLKKVSKLEFQALSIIAAHGERGILQPELTRLSGQDKRSLPSRTTSLAQKGYVVKQHVLAKGMKTSLCTLKQYVKGPGAEGPAAADAHLTDMNDKNPFRDGMVFYGDLFDLVTKILEEQNNKIMVFEDMRMRLGIAGKREETRWFRAAVDRLAVLGLIRRIRARVSHEKVARQDRWLRCLQIVRPIEKGDRESFITMGTRKEKELREELDAEGEDDDELAPDDFDTLENVEVEEAARIAPQWTPERSQSHLLFDLVDKTGSRGISSMDLRRHALGLFWKRPLDSAMGRLTDAWEASQPPHLRHLALIKDIDIVEKANHYRYRSHDNFQRAVEAGQAAWDGVKEMSKIGKKKGRTNDRAARNQTDLDEWGFPRIPTSQVVGRAGDASLVECRTNSNVTADEKGRRSTTRAYDDGIEDSTDAEAKNSRKPPPGPNKPYRPLGRPRKYPKGQEPYKSGVLSSQKRERKRAAEAVEKARALAETLARQEVVSGTKRDAEAAGLDDNASPDITIGNGETQVTNPQTAVDGIESPTQSGVIPPQLSQNEPALKRRKPRGPGKKPSKKVRLAQEKTALEDGADAQTRHSLDVMTIDPAETGLHLTSTLQAAQIRVLGEDTSSLAAPPTEKVPNSNVLSSGAALGSSSADKATGANAAPARKMRGSNHKSSRKAIEAQALEPPVVISEDRVQELMAEILERKMTGVYINPLGSKKPSGTNKGRPRKAIIAVFRSDRLRKMDWFRLNPSTPIPTPSPRRPYAKRSYDDAEFGLDHFVPSKRLHRRSADADEPRLDSGIAVDNTSHGTTLDTSVPTSQVIRSAASDYISTGKPTQNSREDRFVSPYSGLSSHTSDLQPLHTTRPVTPAVDQRMPSDHITASVKATVLDSSVPQPLDEEGFGTIGQHAGTSGVSGLSDGHAQANAPVRTGRSSMGRTVMQMPSDLAANITTSLLPTPNHEEPDSALPRSNKDPVPTSSEVDPAVIPEPELTAGTPESSKMRVDAQNTRNTPKKQSAIAKAGVKFGGGSARFAKSQTILDIMHKAGGVYPGNSEMWHPFVTSWTKQGYTNRPDRTTVLAAINNLVSSGKLRKITFTFKGKGEGSVITKHILTTPDIYSTAQAVEDMRKKIVEKHPLLHLPHEVDIEEQLRYQAEHPNSAGHSVFPKVTFPMIDGQTVERQFQPVRLARLGGRTQKGGETNEQKRVEKTQRSHTYGKTRPRDVYKKRQGLLLEHLGSKDITEDRAAHQTTFPLGNTTYGPPYYSSPYPPRMSSAPVGSPLKLQKVNVLYTTRPQILQMACHLLSTCPAREQTWQQSMTPSSSLKRKRGKDDANNGVPKRPRGRPSIHSTAGQGSGLNGQALVTLQAQGSAQQKSVSLLSNVASWNIESIGLFMNPSQAFHSPSGTFSTEYGSDRQVFRDPGFHKDDQTIFEEMMPNSLKEILQDKRSKFPGRERNHDAWADPAYSRIDLEIKRVQKWETEFARSSNLGGCSLKQPRFINYSFPASDHEAGNGQESRSARWNDCDSQAFTLDHPPPADDIEYDLEDYGARQPKKKRQTGRATWNISLVDPTLQENTGTHDRTSMSNVVETVQTPWSVQFIPTWPSGVSNVLPDATAQQPAPQMTLAQALAAAQVTVSPSVTLPVNAPTPAPAFSAMSVPPPVDALPPAKQRRANRIHVAKPMTQLPPEEIERLIMAIVVVRSLTGGLEQQIAWGMVHQVFHYKYDTAYLRNRWGALKHRFNDVVEKLQPEFQNKFIGAYERKEVPVIDFQHPELYDWDFVVDWAEKNIEGPMIASDEIDELPATRKALDYAYKIQASFEDREPSKDEFLAIATTNQKRELLHHQFPHTILHDAAPAVHNPAVDRLMLAKSWVRANVLTPEAGYDMNCAASKLATLGGELIHNALTALMKEKIIVHVNKGRLTPGRNYDIADQFLHVFKRPLELAHFRQALTLKSKLDAAFRAGESYTIVGHAPDGEFLALENLIANGRVRLVPHLPPIDHDHTNPAPRISKWGFTEGNYRTVQMDRSKIHFALSVTPSPSYTYGNPLPFASHPPPLSHTGSRYEGMLPLWCDIHGGVMRETWHMLLVATLGLLATRPVL